MFVLSDYIVYFWLLPLAGQILLPLIMLLVFAGSRLLTALFTGRHSRDEENSAYPAQRIVDPV